MITLTNRLDMCPGQIPLVVHIGQYDSDYSLVFELYNSTGEFVVETGTTAIIRGTKTDGNGYDAEATLDISAKTVTVTGAQQMTAAKGRNIFELVLLKDGKELSTANFILDVERAAMDAGTITSDSVLMELQAIIDGAATATEAAEQAEAAAEGIQSHLAQIDTNTQDIEELNQDLDSERLARQEDYMAVEEALRLQHEALTAETQAREAADEALENTKADKNGTYPSMAVGSLLGAEVEDKVPYLFRPAGGGLSVGDREYDEIVGGTVGWNQLAKRDGSTSSGATINSSTENSINATFTYASGSWGIAFFTVTNIPFIVGHKYLLLCDLQLASAFTGNLYVVLGGTQSQGDNYFRADTSKTTAQKVDTVINCVTAMESAMIFVQSNTSGITFDLSNIMAIDLTTLFGSTIADYIYSLEQATAGAGVAWFRKLFPNDYYPYSAPTLKSVEGLTAHEMVGFNQWDEEWEVGAINTTNGTNTSTSNTIRSKNYIPVFPNTAYYKQAPVNLLQFYYDASKNFLGFGMWGVGQFTTPQNCAYVRFYTYTTYGTTYNHDICINLSWDGEKDGQYESYVKHSYPLDDSLTLRGIPKLDASNKLYFDGDRYAADGTVTRRYGIQTVTGSETITVNSTYVYRYFTVTGPVPTNSWEMDVFSNLFPKVMSAGSERAIQYDGSKNLRIIVPLSDSLVTVSDMQTFLAANNLQVLYPLATPTEETAESYTSPQIVDDFGTEEYVTDSIVPVGHTTQYPENLADKISDLPSLPTEAGEYKLKVTVVSGKASYEWVTT